MKICHRYRNLIDSTYEKVGIKDLTLYDVDSNFNIFTSKRGRTSQGPPHLLSLISHSSSYHFFSSF